MDRTPNLDMPFILASQAQKHVTHNEALWHLDCMVQLSVLDRDLTEPPATPDEGDRHIVAAGATAEWSGHDGEIAAFTDGAWAFFAPREGWIAWVADEETPLIHTGGGWADFVGSTDVLQNVSLLGVGTTADAVNPFSAKLNNTLLTAKYVGEGGDGDLRLKVNKETAADTVSHLFQTGYSGRAEFGLVGDDDFTVKVSPDGSSWLEALRIDKDTGLVSLPAGSPDIRMKLAANCTYYVNAATGSNANDGLSSVTAFATLQKAIDVVFGTLDLAGYNVTIEVAAGTYTAGIVQNTPQVGAGIVKVNGNTATPSNCTINKTGGLACVYLSGNARLAVQGMKFTGTAFACIRAHSGAIIDVTGKCEYGTIGAHDITAEYGGVINTSVEEIISGTRPGGHYLASSGYIYCQSASWTLSGSPSLGAFAWASGGGVIYAFANSSSGSVTGQRYAALLNGIVNTNGGGASYFPGSSAGSTSAGGQYA